MNYHIPQTLPESVKHLVNPARDWIRQEALIVDVATTGLYPETGSAICQIAIVAIPTDVISADLLTSTDPEPKAARRELLQSGVVRYLQFVNPGHAISPEITRINGITNDHVANAPTWEHIAPTVHEILAEREHRPVLAWNAEFDAKFVDPTATHNWVDLLAVYRDTFCDGEGKYEPGRYQLSRSLMREGLAVPTTTLSPALANALTEANLVRHLARFELTRSSGGAFRRSIG